MDNIIYTILILLTAPLTGYILNSLTKDEKNLIKYYFPTLFIILAITSAILYSINLQYALTTTYIAITTFTWLQLTKEKRKPIKKKKAAKYFCPKCKSTKIATDIKNIGLVFGFQPSLQCQKCGLKSKSFPQKIEELKKNKKAKK
jgi:DNA-directed RNA polymerase subunit M/transcription elongation factor TFIIS